MSDSDSCDLAEKRLTPRHQYKYVAPAADIFYALAREACRQIEEHQPEEVDVPEVARGLAEFLQFVAEVTAKYVNKGHYELFENRSEGVDQ